MAKAEIQVRAFEMNDEAKKKNNAKYCSVVTFSTKSEGLQKYKFYNDNIQVAFVEATNRAFAIAGDRPMTVAHFRSDRYRKIYTVTVD